MKFISFLAALLVVQGAWSEACTKDQAKEAVVKMCGEIEKDGDKSIPTIKKFRFCGDNYVWVQDSDIKMVVHPIKPKLNGESLVKNEDENGLKLFVEFDKKAKAEKDGGWVDYVWGAGFITFAKTH
jgi:methyl-accepting chemotaxis protein